MKSILQTVIIYYFLIKDELEFSGFALNEIVIAKQEMYSINLDISISGEKLMSVNADGLLICSSCGSSAYNSSIRGPLMTPKSSNLLLNFFAPFGKNCLPILGGPEETFEIIISSNNWQNHADLVLDSHTKIPIKKNSKMLFRLNQKDTVKLITDKTNELKNWIKKVSGLMNW